MKLAVGPILYYWPKQQVLDFYEHLRSSPVDIIYLGEVVCARRHELRLEDWVEIAAQLADDGKEVVLSTQGLLESESDLKRVRKIVDNGQFLIEANDHGAVGLLNQSNLPFVAGMHLNIYNADTLRCFSRLGAIRWVPPVEMDRTHLAQLLTNKPDNIETELFAYGRLPLAFSARCFIARHYGLNKDDCQFKCKDHPDGLSLLTQEAQAFLALNGTQTQSAQSFNLLPFIEDLQTMDISTLRLSPQSHGFDQVINAFDQVRKGETPTCDWHQICPEGLCNGYWLGKAGIYYEEIV